MTKFARLGVYAKVYVHSNDNDKKKERMAQNLGF